MMDETGGSEWELAEILIDAVQRMTPQERAKLREGMMQLSLIGVYTRQLCRVTGGTIIQSYSSGPRVGSVTCEIAVGIDEENTFTDFHDDYEALEIECRAIIEGSQR